MKLPRVQIHRIILNYLLFVSALLVGVETLNLVLSSIAIFQIASFVLAATEPRAVDSTSAFLPFSLPSG